MQCQLATAHSFWGEEGEEWREEGRGRERGGSVNEAPVRAAGDAGSERVLHPSGIEQKGAEATASTSIPSSTLPCDDKPPTVTAQHQEGGRDTISLPPYSSPRQLPRLLVPLKPHGSFFHREHFRGATKNKWVSSQREETQGTATGGKTSLRLGSECDDLKGGGGSAVLRAAEGSRLDRLVVPPGHRMLQSAPLLRSLWTFMPAVIAPPVSGEGREGSGVTWPHRLPATCASL